MSFKGFPRPPLTLVIGIAVGHSMNGTFLAELGKARILVTAARTGAIFSSRTVARAKLTGRVVGPLRGPASMGGDVIH